MIRKLCFILLMTALVAMAAPKKKGTAAKKTVPKKVQTEVVKEEAPAPEDDYVSAPPAVDADGEDDDSDDSEAMPTGQMTDVQMEEFMSRKKFEEEQRADEYANSLRRRDWLKDRLILELGVGSRMPFMGETGMGMGFGAGLEYITFFHLAAYASFGYLPMATDNEFDNIDLEGGYGYKVGLNYYLFPKNPLHLGISVSYGTVYFDHDIRPDKDNMRPLITVNGWQFDVLITYLTSEWYYLQFSFGMYYAPELKNKDLSNPSFDLMSKEETEPRSIVVNPDGMSKTGIVFGLTIGFAFPEFFPDDTEIRRREREKSRED